MKRRSTSVVNRSAVQQFARSLAKAADITPEEAARVLRVLKIDLLMQNYNTATKLVASENNRRALGLVERKGRILPPFKFENLGLVIHDRAAAIVDVAR